MAIVVFTPGAVGWDGVQRQLMILATAGALLAARERRQWLDGLLYGVAALSRPPASCLGVLIAVPPVWRSPRRSTPMRAIAGGAGSRSA